MRCGYLAMARYRAGRMTGMGVRKCHQRAPAIRSIIKAINAINAAVPKSCVTIRAHTIPVIAHIGRNLFLYCLIEFPKKSSRVARNITTAHFANSDGWKLTDAGPRGMDNQRRASFFSTPKPGIKTAISNAIARINRYVEKDFR